MQYSLPFNLKNFDSILESLRNYCKKYLDRPDFLAEYIELDELNLLVPELFEQFKELGITLDRAGFMSSPPQAVAPIHTDGSPEWPKYWALNLPIYNCDNTPMIWWDTTGASRAFQSDSVYNSTYIESFDPAECTEVERCIVSQPTWVRIDVPHSVNNTVNLTNRMILTMRFDVSKLQDWHPSILR